MLDAAEMQATGEDGKASALDGQSVAAILLLLLEESDAAAILRQLSPEEVRELARAMFDKANAGETTIDAALDRFVYSSRTVSALSVGADTHIRSVISEAVGNIRADNILAALAPQSSARSLEMLRWMDIEQIRELLLSEHPQVGALILAVLVPDVAVQAIEPLDPALQADLMLRAAQLSSVSAAAIADLEDVLGSVGAAAPREVRQAVGGPSDVAKIIKIMPKVASERTINTIKKKDKKLAQIIEDEMFIFDNLRELSAKNLSTVLRSVDAAMLALALKGSDQTMIDLCLGTMSKRAAETIQDEMAEMTMVKRADVDDAQRSIMQTFRRMIASGEIVVAGAGDDYV